MECPFDRQYILRMCIRSFGGKVLIPSELHWLAPSIEKMCTIQEFFGILHPFIYVTVRHGLVTSTTDDEWHVDGFSMRKEHVPEQNYIFSNVCPTEWLDQEFSIPEDFDALKHNLHWLLQDQVKAKQIKTVGTNEWNLIDPYVVHRRPPDIALNISRTFIRVSFVPIEIESDINTQNPILQTPHYGNTDIRESLTRWKPSGA